MPGPVPVPALSSPCSGCWLISQRPSLPVVTPTKSPWPHLGPLNTAYTRIKMACHELEAVRGIKLPYCDGDILFNEEGYLPPSRLLLETVQISMKMPLDMQHSLLLMSDGHDNPVPTVTAHVPGTEMPLLSLKMFPHQPKHIVLTCGQHICSLAAAGIGELDVARGLPADGASKCMSIFLTNYPSPFTA